MLLQEEREEIVEYGKRMSGDRLAGCRNKRKYQYLQCREGLDGNQSFWYRVF